ncbi:MAG: hypothetical protein M3453_01055, partial [Pseudomonadota bacterium]|nr:hypothetical protein [Pseudomonadota bacterium]
TEFLASDPADDVRSTDRRHAGLCCTLENHVTSSVAVEVVDAFEVVQIEGNAAEIVVMVHG